MINIKENRRHLCLVIIEKRYSNVNGMRLCRPCISSHLSCAARSVVSSRINARRIDASSQFDWQKTVRVRYMLEVCISIPMWPCLDGKCIFFRSFRRARHKGAGKLYDRYKAFSRKAHSRSGGYFPVAGRTGKEETEDKT